MFFKVCNTAPSISFCVNSRGGGFIKPYAPRASAAHIKPDTSHRGFSNRVANCLSRLGGRGGGGVGAADAALGGTTREDLEYSAPRLIVGCDLVQRGRPHPGRGGPPRKCNLQRCLRQKQPSETPDAKH